MRKGKGLKVATLAGSISMLFAGASFAAAPTGFTLNSFSVSNGDITSNCAGHNPAGGSTTTTCSAPVAIGKGFLQEVISIRDNNTGVTKQYIHTVVTDQNANSTAGTLPFQDESLVAYTTD